MFVHTCQTNTPITMHKLIFRLDKRSADLSNAVSFKAGNCADFYISRAVYLENS